MSALYNDGTVQYGSRSWKFYTSDGNTLIGTYECDTITINRPTKAIDRTNEIGEPTGSVGVADFVTGSATAQMADGDAEIQCGHTVICDGVANDQLNGTTETFFVTSVSRTEPKDGEWKLNVSLKKKYGA